jgi:hypothetical protein
VCVSVCRVELRVEEMRATARLRSNGVLFSRTTRANGRWLTKKGVLLHPCFLRPLAFPVPARLGQAQSTRGKM